MKAVPAVLVCHPIETVDQIDRRGDIAAMHRGDLQAEPPAEPAPVAAASQPEADKGGYQVTPHVLRYYQTTRV